jgi:hypothetical protein
MSESTYTVIVDFDGTLTVEESQVAPLAALSLHSLAHEILPHRSGLSRQLVADYGATKQRLLASPHLYRWEVNGLIASYCDEGAFILNTTVLQVMLRDNPEYARAVAAAFPHAEYDPIADCTNHLFHRHTAQLPPAFRPGAREVLQALLDRTELRPLVLTNSLGDKVTRLLSTLALEGELEILGDTRQYDMDPQWTPQFAHTTLSEAWVWPVSDLRRIDLRRPAYYRALARVAQEMKEGEDWESHLVVVADTLSLPGALPLAMGIPFLLLRTPYTPDWCAEAVGRHPDGHLLEDLRDLPDALAAMFGFV